MSSSSYRYCRASYRRPSFQLTHVDLTLSLWDDHVDGREELTLRVREASDCVSLDAQDLEIVSVGLCEAGAERRPLNTLQDKRANRLDVLLPRVYAEGEMLTVEVRAVCRPTENILDGLYYDTTPAGAPPQMISQCQQWGFQRIMPIIDDCTAKCTWRTTLEGSSRYTHLISNGDICRETNPDGVPVPLAENPARMRITYVNSIPMPPYLFLVAAGTWDELTDTVTTEKGRTIQLSYLVPPGKVDGAKAPMAILKDAVCWQATRLNYDYQRDCYRTICMEKSNFGGMENVGNTTIITEAALIDEWTPERRLVYAYGVILHEFEHNHCGSDVTMETPFDMWLNEAYTVTIERAYLADRFGSEMIRLADLDAMRAPLQGPLAVEDTGTLGRVVREGFNHPDEVVDGVTYVKAPEVLRMLERVMGSTHYEAALKAYFARYQGGNANTDEFLANFQAFSTRDLTAFFHEWLFTIGYPRVTATWHYDAQKRCIEVELEQRRCGGEGGSFVIPIHVTGVTATGEKMASVQETLILDQPRMHFVIESVETAPAFLDWNSDGAFYGVFQDTTQTPQQCAQIVRYSPFGVGRVEAMLALLNHEMEATIGALECGEATPQETPEHRLWLSLYPQILEDSSISCGIRARLLTIPVEMLDRAYLPRPHQRVRAANQLRRAVAESVGLASLLTHFEAARQVPPDEPLGDAISRRALLAALANLLAAFPDAPAAVKALEQLDATATCLTERMIANKALLNTCAPSRWSHLKQLGEDCRPHVAAYGSYLQLVGSIPTEAVFEKIREEEQNGGFRMDHPGHSRALYAAMASNHEQLWGPSGLAWAESTLRALAPVNEYVALVVLSAFQQVAKMPMELKAPVSAMLARLAVSFSAGQAPSFTGRLQQLLEGAHE